jgi:hypothetical protein
MDERRRSGWMVAGFAAALYLALVVCVYGFVSLLANVEVIPSRQAGLFVGPAIVAAAVLALLLHLGRALRTPGRALTAVLLAALWTWLAAVAVAIVAFAMATGTVLAAVLFGLGFGVSWFGLLVPVLAALVTWLATTVTAAQAGGAERPRWPWERNDDD